MHLDATQLVTLVSSLVTIAVVIASHVFHANKIAAKIEAIGAVAVKEAPAVAQAAEAVAEAAK